MFFACKEREKPVFCASLNKIILNKDCQKTITEHGIGMNIDSVATSYFEQMNKPTSFLLLVFWTEGEVIERYVTAIADNDKNVTGKFFYNYERESQDFSLKNSSVEVIKEKIKAEFQHEQPYSNTLLMIGKSEEIVECFYSENISTDVAEFLQNPSSSEFLKNIN